LSTLNITQYNQWHFYSELGEGVTDATFFAATPGMLVAHLVCGKVSGKMILVIDDYISGRHIEVGRFSPTIKPDTPECLVPLLMYFVKWFENRFPLAMNPEIQRSIRYIRPGVRFINPETATERDLLLKV